MVAYYSMSHMHPVLQLENWCYIGSCYIIVWNNKLVETIKLVLAGIKPAEYVLCHCLWVILDSIAVSLFSKSKLQRDEQACLGNPCSLSFVNIDNIVNIAIGAPPMSHLHPVLQIESLSYFGVNYWIKHQKTCVLSQRKGSFRNYFYFDFSYSFWTPMVGAFLLCCVVWIHNYVCNKTTPTTQFFQCSFMNFYYS